MVERRTVTSQVMETRQKGLLRATMASTLGEVRAASFLIALRFACIYATNILLYITQRNAIKSRT